MSVMNINNDHTLFIHDKREFLTFNLYIVYTEMFPDQIHYMRDVVKIFINSKKQSMRDDISYQKHMLDTKVVIFYSSTPS